MTTAERSFLHQDLMTQAGFEPREIERFGDGLEENAHLYHTIFQRINERGKGEDFWYKFRIYAGVMTNWAKDLPAKTEITSYNKFLELLHEKNTPLFSELDETLGTINTDNRPDSLLAKWSYTAALISQAQLQGKYVSFLDCCAEQSVGYPTYRWRQPFGQVIQPQPQQQV